MCYVSEGVLNICRAKIPYEEFFPTPYAYEHVVMVFSTLFGRKTELCT